MLYRLIPGRRYDVSKLVFSHYDFYDWEHVELDDFFYEDKYIGPIYGIEPIFRMIR